MVPPRDQSQVRLILIGLHVCDSDLVLFNLFYFAISFSTFCAARRGVTNFETFQGHCTALNLLSLFTATLLDSNCAERGISPEFYSKFRSWIKTNGKPFLILLTCSSTRAWSSGRKPWYPSILSNSPFPSPQLCAFGQKHLKWNQFGSTPSWCRDFIILAIRTTSFFGSKSFKFHTKNLFGKSSSRCYRIKSLSLSILFLHCLHDALADFEYSTLKGKKPPTSILSLCCFIAQRAFLFCCWLLLTL